MLDTNKAKVRDFVVERINDKWSLENIMIDVYNNFVVFSEFGYALHVIMQHNKETQ